MALRLPKLSDKNGKMVFLPVEGEPTLINFEDDYRDLAQLIGAKYVQQVFTKFYRDGLVMIVDGEGKLYDVPVNKKATKLYEADELVGNAIVLRADWAGDEIEWFPLSEENIETLFESFD